MGCMHIDISNHKQAFTYVLQDVSYAQHQLPGSLGGAMLLFENTLNPSDVIMQ